MNRSVHGSGLHTLFASLSHSVAGHRFSSHSRDRRLQWGGDSLTQMLGFDWSLWCSFTSCRHRGHDLTWRMTALLFGFRWRNHRQLTLSDVQGYLKDLNLSLLLLLSWVDHLCGFFLFFFFFSVFIFFFQHIGVFPPGTEVVLRCRGLMMKTLVINATVFVLLMTVSDN